jgi:DNA-binding IclR family transcriptional regulator
MSGRPSSGVAARRPASVRRNGAPATGAQVLERTVALLYALAQAGRPLSGAELAGRCALPASTTYRLIADLERHGLVAREGRQGATLGLRVLELARSVEDRLEAALVEPARDVMQGLARDYGETAILTAPTGQLAIGLASVESPTHAVRLTYGRWRVAPMHLGASGKVLLAHLDRRAADRVIAAALDGSFGGQPLDEAALRDQLAETRRNGYVVTHGELDEGASAAAAPVLDGRGRLVAGLSLAGPTARMRRTLDAIVPAVADGARAIAARIAPA